MKSWRVLAVLAVCVAALSVNGCTQTYYKAWEKLGWHKRDLLVDEVKDTRTAQEDATKQFQTTLQRLQEVARTQPDHLQARYDKLKADYDRSVSRAETVRTQIRDVDAVAKDLFKEWEAELAQYSSDEMRRTSEQQLRDTRSRYQQLIAAMRRAESKMDPVLKAFSDQVLFLKHNLNARSIAQLDQTRASIESDVAGLIRDMEASIREANGFIQEMQK